MKPPTLVGYFPSHRLRRFGLAALIVLLSLAYWSGVKQVPFHPDESTQTFMSADVEAFLSQPASLFWTADKAADLRQRYRELDAPLTRTLIGLARAVTRQPALPADWDWSLTWAENADRGALPGDRLLLIARLAVSFLFPISLLLMYDIGRRLNGDLTGGLALLLLAGSALVLLHTRRAMAESTLLFTTLLAMNELLRRPLSPVRLGASAALAFCAKQSALIFLPLAAFWLILSPRPTRTFHRIGLDLLRLTAAFALLVLFLNPFLWAHPIQAARAALTARQDLLTRQMEAVRAVNPEKVLSTPGDRLAGLAANLFFLKPAVEDIANYTQDLALSRSAYLSNPLHTLLRSPAGGAAQLAFTLLGLALVVRLATLRSHPRREALWILLGVFIATLAGLWVGIPLPFQRYVFPLLPPVLLLQAFGVSRLLQAIPTFFHKKTGEA